MSGVVAESGQKKLDSFFGGELSQNPADDMLAKMEGFVSGHCSSLREIHDSFSPRLTDSWDGSQDFISLNVSPFENVNNPLALVKDHTDIPEMNKVLMVLSSLCQEMIQLRRLAEQRFYDPLTVFGLLRSDSAASALNLDRSQVRSTEQQMGEFVPFLQQLSNFVDRINAVVKGTLEQCSQLFNEHSAVYARTFSRVKLNYVWRRLSETLTILVTLDSIVRNNEELRDAWESYKKMIGYVRSIPDKMGMDDAEAKLADFQHLIVRLESSILKASMFENCLNQKFGVRIGEGKVPSHMLGQYELMLRASYARSGRKDQETRLESAIRSQRESVAANRSLYKELTRYMSEEKLRVQLDCPDIAAMTGQSIALGYESAKKSGSSSLDDSGSSSSKSGKGKAKGKSGSDTMSLLSSFDNRRYIVDLFSLYALCNRLFITAKQDFKFWRDLWYFQRVLPLIHLHGRAVWFLSDFMRVHIPLSKDHDKRRKKLDPLLDPGKISADRLSYLKRFDLAFPVIVQRLFGRMNSWMIEWDNDLNTQSSSVDIRAILRKQSTLMIEGLMLATNIQNAFSLMHWLHYTLGKSVTRSLLKNLSICGELLKSIDEAFHRGSRKLSSNVSYMLTVIAFQLQSIFQPLRKKLGKLSSPSEGQLDCHACLTVIADLLQTAPTLSRVVVINLCASVGSSLMSSADTKNEHEIAYRLFKLEVISNYRELLKKATNCSSMYWSLDFIRPILNDIYANPKHAHRLPAVLSYLNDPVPMLKSDEINVIQSDSGEQSSLLLEMYQSEIISALNDEVIEELCKVIENDLRLQVMDLLDIRHKTKSMFGGRLATYDAQVFGQSQGASSSASNKGGITGQSSATAAEELYARKKEYVRFILLKPFRVLNELIEIKNIVERYLNRMFYDLATVALHQGEVYAEMRSLAKQKYGLDLVETHLPSQSHLNEALDVLKIMRSIQRFVVNYNYNLNSQIFVERAFDQLHLNTINVQHIAASIRTHGRGIMSTTANFTYQFCVSKFRKFSEFLYDENIKSRLIRDLNEFEDIVRDKHLQSAAAKKDSMDAVPSPSLSKSSVMKGSVASSGGSSSSTARFPWEMAKRFVAMIRSFGQDKRGQTFLDHFRMIITQIGNALGYIRMVRSGGLYYMSQSVKYIPDIDAVPKFEDLITGVVRNEDDPQPSEEPKKAEVSPESLEAAQNLDEILGGLSESFLEGIDFYKMLTDAFERLLATADQSHLRNFVVIMPALTLNFVDSQIVKKDRLQRKPGIHDEAGFTDDGFALGCAFMLRVLHLFDQFDAFHWWDEVMHRLDSTERELSERRRMNERKQQERQAARQAAMQAAEESHRKKKKRKQPSTAKTSTSLAMDFEDDDIDAVAFERSKAVRKEWELLFFSFEAARIFFRDKDETGGKQGTEEGAGESAAQAGNEQKSTEDMGVGEEREGAGEGLEGAQGDSKDESSEDSSSEEEIEQPRKDSVFSHQSFDEDSSSSFRMEL